MKNKMQNTPYISSYDLLREHKFRAWVPAYNHMAYQGTPDLEKLSSFMHHYSDHHLMQATGVFDKKGKEFFELDIVTYTISCKNGENHVSKNKKGRYIFHVIVIFEKGAFIAKQIRKYGNLTYGFPLSGLQNELIVGNYYQRPNVCWLL